MIPIQANPHLAFDARDLGVRLGKTCLEVPPEVDRLLRSMGVREASLLVPTLHEMPVAFITGLRLSLNEFMAARETLARRLHEAGIDTGAEAGATHHRFGALPPDRPPDR
jgi:hypothetical protein